MDLTSTNIENIADALWVEKYRPKTINDVVLQPDQYHFLNQCIEKKEVPHLLLIGIQGSGKCHDGEVMIDIWTD